MNKNKLIFWGVVAVVVVGGIVYLRRRSQTRMTTTRRVHYDKPSDEPKLYEEEEGAEIITNDPIEESESTNTSRR